jgi:hypothetical protein
LGRATHTNPQYTHSHKSRLELKMKHREFTTRTELKSLTRSIKCAETECGDLELLSECLSASSMRLGVPFIAPRQLGAVGSQQGRPKFPSIRWCTGQSSAPLDSPCSMSGADLLPNLAQTTVAPQRRLAHRTLFGAHRTVWCPLPTVGAGHVSPADFAADRWLTGQSGAPPDSSVNSSRTPWNFSRERRLRRGRLTGQSGAPPDSPVNYSRTPPSSRLVHLGLVWRIRHCPVHHRTVRCTQTEQQLAVYSQLFSNLFSPVSST